MSLDYIFLVIAFLNIAVISIAIYYLVFSRHKSDVYSAYIELIDYFIK